LSQIRWYPRGWRRWHHRCACHRCKTRWRRWRVSLCRVEYRHPAGWCWRRHPRGHTHTHGWHGDCAWNGRWGLHLRLHRPGRESRRWGRCGCQCASKLSLVGAREATRDRLYTTINHRGRAWGQRKRVVLSGLRCQEPFRSSSVTLTLPVLFEGILHRDRLVHEELPVHGFNSRVRGFEVSIRHESVTLRLPCLRIACNL
jgi:hypothetical protein